MTIGHRPPPVVDGDGGPGGDEPRGLSHLTEHIQDAIVAFELVEDEPIVRSVNEAFVETFGYDRETVVGTSLNDHIVPAWLTEQAQRLDDRTDAGSINYERVRRQTADGLKEFLYRGIPYDAGEHVDGYAIYTDLTEIVRTERQFQVLNRILRHNLRNELTVIDGGLEQLVDGTADADAQLHRSVRDAVDGLLSLTEEAGRINQILDVDTADLGALEAVSLVESTVERCADRYPEATITTDLPDELVLVGTTDLAVALESLLENAVEHNPAAAPRVNVVLEEVGDGAWVDLCVCDDGPLIPAAETAVVTGSAAITPTRHGSGLGLWLVRWTVDQFGGKLGFEESSLGGNRVRLRLRKRR